MALGQSKKRPVSGEQQDSQEGQGSGCLPGEVMFCTRGLTRASQQVLPSAWAASLSGRKRSAKFCSWRRAPLSLELMMEEEGVRESRPK